MPDIYAAFEEKMPPELIIKILDQLDFLTMMRCRIVCSTFRNLIDSSPCLQWKVELAIAGQEDGSNYPLAASRKMLAQHQSGWAELRWTGEQHWPLFDGTQGELYGNIIAQDASEKTKILFKHLRSNSRNIGGRDWEVDIRQFQMRDFGMDPGQDLLVIVEVPRRWLNERNYNIILRTFSGDLHPLVTGSSTLIHEQKENVGDKVPCIQICGDALGILFGHWSYVDTEVVIWNWKTGQVLVNLTSNVISSMDFLSEKHVILARVGPSASETCLIVVDFMAEPPERHSLDEVENSFTFCFPPTVHDLSMICVRIRSDPAPSWRPAPELHAPFFNAGKNRLHFINLFIRAARRRPRTVHLFAISNTFLSLINNVGRRRASFDWDIWGPCGSRMMVPDYFDVEWLSRCVYGTRYVTLRQFLTESSENIYVYDFNQLALRWNKDSPASFQNKVTALNAPDKGKTKNTMSDYLKRLTRSWNKKSPQHNPGSSNTSATDVVLDGQFPDISVTDPSTFTDHEIFRDPVETRLGYKRRSFTIPPNLRVGLRSVMCSEDGIILVCSTPEGDQFHMLTV